MNFRKGRSHNEYTYDISDYYFGSVASRKALIDWLTEHKISDLCITYIEEDQQGNLKVHHLPDDDQRDSLFGIPMSADIIYRIPKELNDFPWNKVLQKDGIEEIGL